MRSVGLKILKNKLSEYVRLASQGEVILISDRDKVVAELIAPQASRGPSVSDALLADLLRQGLITPALHSSGSAWERKSKPVAKLSQVLEELDKDRDR